MLPSSVRVYDSRRGTAPKSFGPKTPLAAREPRAIRVDVNNSHVPATATAVVVNATVTPSSERGQLTLYKAGTTKPGTSTLNWSATAHPVANSATVAIGGGQLEAYASAKTDLIIDVVGYYILSERGCYL